MIHPHDVDTTVFRQPQVGPHEPLPMCLLYGPPSLNKKQTFCACCAGTDNLHLPHCFGAHRPTEVSSEVDVSHVARLGWTTGPRSGSAPDRRWTWLGWSDLPGRGGNRNLSHPKRTIKKHQETSLVACGSSCSPLHGALVDGFREIPEDGPEDWIRGPRGRSEAKRIGQPQILGTGD